MLGSVRNLWAGWRRRNRTDPDASWMRELTGVVHVGANAGQEREHYRQYELPVIWIEPIPEVFARLQSNIASIPAQRAVQALVAEVEGAQVEFNVSSNQGLSSSILPLGKHLELWPDVGYSRTLQLRTTTIDALVRDGVIAPPQRFNGLVMDTQGSELRVLQGALSLLPHVDYVQTEAADFEAYVGCCRLDELGAFLEQQGFDELRRLPFAGRTRVGTYYDVVYRRRGPAAAPARSPSAA
jgi:FkbM family methyltransferase